MQKVFITHNSSQTKKLGMNLAKEILRTDGSFKAFAQNELLKTNFKKTAFVLGLEGDLGGGKTTFLQGFAKGLGIKQKILSPTFIIMRKFLISNPQFLNFYHIDCYRIQKSKEILDLGFKKVVSSSPNIVAIEWADRVKKFLPKGAIWIKFKFIGKNKREILIKK